MEINQERGKGGRIKMSVKKDKEISEDIQYVLGEAYHHVQKFFGTPEENYRDQTHLEVEEDRKLKAIAFKSILKTLLKIYVEGS